MSSSRLYTIPETGERVPSVTTILATLAKPALERWYRANGFERCDEISREARTLGTALHAAIEACNRGTVAPCSDDVRPMVEAYLAWKAREVVEVIGIEQVAHCRCGWRFAGTADVILRLRGDWTLPVVADFKTSRAVYDEYALQLSAYRHALRCSLELDTASERLVLRFDKQTGALEEHWFDDDERDWQAFAGLSVAWWRLCSKQAFVSQRRGKVTR